ncbi:MAG: NAD(P)/FAD-dependent oxidoreductase [Candidatus Omnitrophota bacterium]
MKSKCRYAVVGGGAAGCTLAWHLSRNGHEVVVYEREKGLGGLASAIPFGRTRLDRFYHHIFTSDDRIQSYIQLLGLASDLHWRSSSVGFEYKGELYPFTTPKDLLTFRPLSWLSRLRVGWTVLKAQRIKSYEPLEKITAEEWIVREMGEQAYRVLWEPLLRSKFGDRYREVSAVWFWGKVKLRGGTRSKSGAGECLGYLKGGWGRIFDCMGEQIAKQGGIFRFHEIVKAIEPSGKGLIVRTRAGTDEFDRVIFTPSLATFAETVPSLPEEVKAKYGAIPFQANITAALGLERSISPYYWLNITAPESPFVAVIEHSRLFDDPDYGELTPVYLSRYLDREHPMFKTRPSFLRDMFAAQLERIFPNFRREWIREFTLSKAHFAQPVVGLLYSANRPAFDTPLPGLYLCTMAQIYPEDRGMNYSMKIAEELLRQLGEWNRTPA